MTTASRLDELPPIRLTELTECGGCAAKLGAGLLAEALSGLGAGTDRDPALISHQAIFNNRELGKLAMHIHSDIAHHSHDSLP